MVISKSQLITPLLALSSLALASQASALTVTLDYSYDTGNFFSNVEAKASLEAARDVYVGIIDQSFNAITPGGGNSWTASFTNPSSGNAESISNMSIAADTIVIYVGGRNLGGSTIGYAGRGGYSWSGSNEFQTSVSRGDSSSQYGLWGGAATFDSAGTDWHYNHNTSVTSGKIDFYSTALHELGHVFGLGIESDAWDDHWSSGEFSGANAVAAYGNDNEFPAIVVPTAGGDRHFADGTQSYIYGTTTLQEVAMDPDISAGTRKHLTNVDIASLQDIGWQSVPEPSSSGLMALGGITLMLRRKRSA